MHLLPKFIAPTRHTDAAAALAQVQAIYDAGIQHLRTHMQHYVSGKLTAEQRVRACYPLVRLHTHHSARQDQGLKER